MKAIDQLVVRRRRIRQDAEPAERIDAVIVLEQTGWKARPADAMEPIAAADEVASDLLRPALIAEAYFWLVAVEMNAGVRNLEQNLPAVRETLGNQVGDHLLLIVDEHLLANQ